MAVGGFVDVCWGVERVQFAKFNGGFGQLHFWFINHRTWKLLHLGPRLIDDPVGDQVFVFFGGKINCVGQQLVDEAWHTTASMMNCRDCFSGDGSVGITTTVADGLVDIPARLFAVERVEVTPCRDPLAEPVHRGCYQQFIKMGSSEHDYADSRFSITLQIGQGANGLEDFRTQGLSFVNQK